MIFWICKLIYSGQLPKLSESLSSSRQSSVYSEDLPSIFTDDGASVITDDGVRDGNEVGKPGEVLDTEVVGRDGNEVEVSRPDEVLDTEVFGTEVLETDISLAREPSLRKGKRKSKHRYNTSYPLMKDTLTDDKRKKRKM